MTRTISALGLAVAVLFSVLSVRAVLEARAGRARAERALGQGEVETAIVELRRAARWLSPVNPYATSALEALGRIAAEAQARGDAPLALSAHRATHAAIHAARSFYTPESERLARTDRAIASLMALERPAEIDVARTVEQRADDYREALGVTRPREPSVFFALFGFSMWVSGAIVFMAHGLDAQGRLVRSIGKRSGLSVVLGWIAFALGLRCA